MFCAPGLVLADQSIAISPGIIEVNEILDTNTWYDLDYVRVYNRSDMTIKYQIDVVPYFKEGFQKIESDYLKLKPNAFLLNPGESQSIHIEIKVPKAGKYYGVVAASPLNTDIGAVSTLSIGSILQFTAEGKDYNPIYLKIKVTTFLLILIIIIVIIIKTIRMKKIHEYKI